MDDNELIRHYARAVVDENDALKAEVARLKLQNESLEIRLAAEKDRVMSLRQFIEGETVMRRWAEAALESATASLDTEKKILDYCRQQWHQIADKHEELRQELLRRGADDPLKPKPPCQTAMSALQLVCKWDRDVYVEDLKKQRLENLQKIDVLKTGKELMMDDVVNEMNKDGCRMMPEFEANLHYVLRELREQLREIFESIPTDSAHEEWFKYPLSMFRLDYVEDSDMDESVEMDA